MEYLKREDADIIALQETKCETIKIPTEAKLQGYKRYYLESKLIIKVKVHLAFRIFLIYQVRKLDIVE